MPFTKTCVTCGNPFVTDNMRKKTCCKRSSKSRNGKRTETRSTNDLHFIGVDGEGVGRPDGNHDYVMLSVGDKTLMHDDGSQLSYLDIFPFLWEQYLENKTAAFIGFYLGYDFTQWTKTLPESAGYQLWSKKAQIARKPKISKNPDPFPVICDGWEFDIMTKRRFRLRKHVCVGKKMDPSICRLCLKELKWSDGIVAEPKEWSVENVIATDIDVKWSEFGNQKVKPYGWMYICDTGPFWQMSLMSALNPKDWPHPICTPDEFDKLRRGKETRSKWVEYGDISVYAEMAEYNTLENDVLARMTTELNRGFAAVNLFIRAREWYGPGRCAQTWLDQLAATMPEGESITRLDISMSVPEYARTAGRMSYYGGWFEQFMHGHIEGMVEEDDINSAYPWVISKLPCLHHGKWSEGEGKPRFKKSSLYLLYCTVEGSNPYIGAMPHRMRSGKILRPLKTKGWYWKHEIDAASAAGLIDTIDVHSYVAYDPCLCPPPLASIASLYKKRLEVGKESPQGKALKLVYNSSYGKFAQSVGMPKYANPIYASLITAGCRVRILEAIATHPEGAAAVTMIATDGIYFTSPHPALELSDTELGKWGNSTKTDMTQFMPGVYWDNKLRDVLTQEVLTGNSSAKLPSKTRGINVRDLANKVHELDAQFDKLRIDVESGLDVNIWPSLDIPVNFDMVSATQAIARRQWNTAGKVTTAEDGNVRTINSTPANKRRPTAYWDSIAIRTFPYTMADELETTYYTGQFGEDIVDWRLLNEFEGPNGDADSMFGWILRGDF